MSETTLASTAQLWRRLVKGLLAGIAALAAITVSRAAVPDPAEAPDVAAPRDVAPRPRPMRPPAPPPTFIAFCSPLPDGEVGSPFGLRQLPWEDQARLHAGVDMVAPAPELVLASTDGVVTEVSADPGYGRFVELKHAGGFTTLYGHLDRIAPGVAVGVAVKAGTPVGLLGDTGASTGVHLHFEVHDPQDRPLNPEVLLGHAYAREADLPLREARHIPRRVRVAYVSRIPRSKHAEMVARLADDLAAQASADGDQGRRAHLATAGRAHGHGRLHVRLRS